MELPPDAFTIVFRTAELSFLEFFCLADNKSSIVLDTDKHDDQANDCRQRNDANKIGPHIMLFIGHFETTLTFCR